MVEALFRTSPQSCKARKISRYGKRFQGMVKHGMMITGAVNRMSDRRRRRMMMGFTIRANHFY